MVREDEFIGNAFVNCPFDEDYDHILQAILFCLVKFGLRPRLSSERSDAGESRVSKILELIKSSRYSVHDLSSCEAKREGEYYRLNMPFELGLEFDCRHYGDGCFSTNVILVLEEERYRYQATISDLNGSDIEAHGGASQLAVRKVRNWLVGIGGFKVVRAAAILAEYKDFQRWFYDSQISAGFSEEDIKDYSTAELLQAMLIWNESSGLHSS